MANLVILENSFVLTSFSQLGIRQSYLQVAYYLTHLAKAICDPFVIRLTDSVALVKPFHLTPFLEQQLRKVILKPVFSEKCWNFKPTLKDIFFCNQENPDWAMGIAALLY